MSLGGYMGMKYGFGQRTTNEFKLGYEIGQRTTNEFKLRYEIMKIEWYYCILKMSYDLKAQA
jgi:hypothetical protein